MSEIAARITIKKGTFSGAVRRQLRGALALDVARAVLAQRGLDLDRCLPKQGAGGRLRTKEGAQDENHDA